MCTQILPLTFRFTRGCERLSFSGNGTIYLPSRSMLLSSIPSPLQTVVLHLYCWHQSQPLSCLIQPGTDLSAALPHYPLFCSPYIYKYGFSKEVSLSRSSCFNYTFSLAEWYVTFTFSKDQEATAACRVLQGKKLYFPPDL